MNSWSARRKVGNRKKWTVSPFSWVIGIIFLSHLSFADEGVNPKHLVLVTPAPVTNFVVQRATAVYDEALRKLDYSLEIRRCEPILCTLLANRGEVDGELMRAAMYQSLVPDLVKLTESGLSIRWAAYSVDKELRLQNWQHIRHSGLRVVFLAGLPYLESKLSGGVAGTQLTKVRHWSLGLDRLKRGEADIYVGSDAVVGAFLDRPEYDGIYRAGIIDTLPLYLYLNKKYAKLAAELSLVIAEMKEEGQIDKIYQTIFLQKGAE